MDIRLINFLYVLLAKKKENDIYVVRISEIYILHLFKSIMFTFRYICQAQLYKKTV